MPKNDLIESEPNQIRQDQRRYLLGDFLKAGLIGVVYPAVSYDDEKLRVAVKLPAPGVTDADSSFNMEYDVMLQLARAVPEPRLVPWIQWGNNKTSGGRGLIMEFIGEEKILSNRLAQEEANPLERERLALYAASQYARLLQALHALHYSCPDRKLADLRWLEDYPEGRLVTLDWNVLRKGAQADPAEDIHLFGVLWYQLLTGRFPTGSLNPLNDPLWRAGKVTYGTRRLLLKALSNNPAEKFSSAAALLTAINERLAVLALTPEALLKEARPLAEQMRWIVNKHRDAQVASRRFGDDAIDLPSPDLEGEWKALDLLDLAARKGSDEAAGGRDESLSWVKGQGARLVGLIESSFRFTRYDLGKQAIAWSKKAIEQNQDARLALQLARWSTLIAAGEQAVQEGFMLRPIRDELANWLDKVETGGEKAEVEHWAEWEREPDMLLRKAQVPAVSRTGALILSLKEELAVYKYLAEARQEELAGRYQEARSRVELARLAADHVRYQSELAGALPDLKEWEAQLLRRQYGQRNLRALHNRVPEPGAYLAYTLGVFLQDHRDIINSLELGEQEKFEELLDFLKQFQRLQELRARAETDPQNWVFVIQAVREIQNSPVFAWDENDPAARVRPAASKILREHVMQAEKAARELKKRGLYHTDLQAKQILTALLTLEPKAV